MIVQDLVRQECATATLMAPVVEDAKNAVNTSERITAMMLGPQMGSQLMPNIRLHASCTVIGYCLSANMRSACAFSSCAVLSMSAW